MRNKLMSSGATMPFANAGADSIPGGAVVIMDAGGTPFAGVTVADIAPGDIGLLDTQGVYRLPKDATALTAHAAVYWDSATAKVSAKGVYIGRAWEAADANAAEVLVRLNFGPAPAAGA